MTEKLSTELLLKVISYLQPKEKRQGLLVCKNWYQPFLYGLYYEIQIETPRQLELLFHSLTHNTHVIPHGHYTKVIRLHKRTTFQNSVLQEHVIIPFTLFQKLPDLCPNLEVLNFDVATWKFISFDYKIAQWKGTIKKLPTMTSLGTSLPFLQCLGKGLTCLSIQSGMLLDVATHHRLLSIISLTPYLEHFSIVEEGSYVPPATLSLALQDIELIHTVLPRLESLVITGAHIELSIADPSPDQLFLIDQIPTQSHTIKKLDWNTSLTPITWLHYITHKYPYIKDLTISIFPSSSSPPLCRSETSFYIQLVARCKYLETISLASPSLCHWFNPSFFQTLSFTTVHQVRPILHKENRIRFESELTFASEYSRFITALEIDQWRFNIPFTATLNLLSLLHNLVHLELRFDSYNKQYSIQSILQSCPLLTHLALEWGSLTVTSPPGKTKYRLQTLDLSYIAFDPTLFQYLGNQCKSLSTLVLFKCKQSCQLERPSTHTVIALDMPENAFDLIVINGVRLDYSHADLYMHGISSYARLVSIQKQSTLNQRWYSHTGYTSIHKRSPILHSLNPKDTTLVETYFEKRKRGPYKEKETVGLLSMEFGYIEIKCKLLKKFVLDGDIR
ncbi:hypothetical protein EDC94DRAFT_604715 [Helicostylum pulchrum]|nr:hypothetical protein EDC94DRAFT_604715 [Helicostylum pulchrum]